MAPQNPRNANGKEKTQNGGDLGFEAELFKTADKLRGNMEPSDYKHVALGLIFLKHISDSFEAKHSALLADYPEGAEDPDEYSAENIFWVPKEARWSHLQANAKQPSIGRLIDEAMIAIEKRNESLKGVLPKEYARPALNAVMLGELIDLISGITLGREGEARDVLGRVYEYFLGQFAGSEGKRGGEFYTPRSVVRVMVEMLEPYKGRVYDPCCGSGGMFVQSEKFAEEHEGRIGDIAVYGQESNYTTWRLCKMNLAVRGIDADIRWNSEGSFHKDELRDLKADFILANPPFNISDWGGDRLSASQLQAVHKELFGAEHRVANPQHLRRKIAWHLQAAKGGGIPESVRLYAIAVARGTELRSRISENASRRQAGGSLEQTVTTTVVQTGDARLPMPGSLIVKKYKTQTVVVKILDNGFEYDGRRFASLSAVAGEITGTRWNGFAFFGLEKAARHAR